jgi:hypothetical protein
MKKSQDNENNTQLFTKGGVIMKNIENDENKTLEDLIKEGSLQLQPHEKIVKNQIVTKTIEEQVAEGVIVLAPQEKLEEGEIVRKTLKERVEEGLAFLNEPFEYIAEDIKKNRPIAEVVEKGFLKTCSQCEEALAIMNKEIEAKIAEKYSFGYEVKLVKRYTEWLNDGKPAKDRREKKYLDMQIYIEDMKKQYKPLREKVRKIMNKAK